MQNKYIIGLDIGLRGGITLLNDDKKIIHCIPIPTIKVLVGKKIRNQYDISAINNIIKSWSLDYKIAMAGMERLRAIPHQSSQTGFSMGGGSMLFKTLFTVYSIPFIETEPRCWQQNIFKSLGIQYNKKTTKQASIQAAKRLYPERDFLATPACRVPSDGLTDSLCLGIFIINNNLCH